MVSTRFGSVSLLFIDLIYMNYIDQGVNLRSEYKLRMHLVHVALLLCSGDFLLGVSVAGDV